jgi:hypothetical protein
MRSKLDATKVLWHETKLETPFSRGCKTNFSLDFKFWL